MKTPIPTLTTVVVMATIWLSGPGSAQDLTASEKKQIKLMIDELNEKLHGGSATNNSRAVTTLQTILKSPKATYQYYMDSIKELQFDAVGKRESEWREWKDRNEDRLKSTEHVAALQYQVKFLLLTLAVALEKDEGIGVKKVMPVLIEYYDDLTRDIDKLEGHRRVLNAAGLESVFAKRLKLPLTLPRLKTWIKSPLPVSAAYDGVILPHFRSEKNHPALQAAWDKRIEHESKTLDVGSGGGGLNLPAGLPAGIPSDLAKRFGLDSRDRDREGRREETRQKKLSEEEFTKERLPQLRWGKNRDALLLGSSQASALNALGRIIRDNLTHPDAAAWLEELKNLADGGGEAESQDSTGETE